MLRKSRGEKKAASANEATTCVERSARRGHFITFIAHPPSPSTLSGVNVEEDIQRPALHGKRAEHVERLATLMLNGSLKTAEMNEAWRATRPYVTHVNYRRGRGKVYLLLLVKGKRLQMA